MKIGFLKGRSTPRHGLFQVMLTLLINLNLRYIKTLLLYLTLNYGNDPKYNFADNIVESLAQFSPLVEQGLDSLPIINRIRDYISDGYIQKVISNNTQN
jgi:hypothetical protein